MSDDETLAELGGFAGTGPADDSLRGIIRRKLRERAAIEDQEQDPASPWISRFVVERPEGRKAFLAIEAPCAYCGGSHRVSFDRPKALAIRPGFKFPTAPCDPTKRWMPRVSVKDTVLDSYVAARKELKAAGRKRGK